MYNHSEEIYLPRESPAVTNSPLNVNSSIGTFLSLLIEGSTLMRDKSKLTHPVLASPPSEPEPSKAAYSVSKQRLLEWIQDHTAALLGTLRLYVLRSGLAPGEQISAVALEVLQDTIVEALAHVDRYRLESQPMAWLLGIAVNVIKRHQRAAGRRARREISLGHLSTHAPEPLVEADLLDHLLPSSETGPEHTVEADEQARALLALVSVEDQQVLRLAVLEGFDSASLAERLKTSPGASRARLHRALSRLRAAWKARQEAEQGESKDA